MNTVMTTLLAHIKVHEGKEAQFEQISREVYQGTHANEQETMNRYEYFRGEEKGQYYVLLSFNDFNGFMTHQVADYHNSIGPGLNECVADIKLEYADPMNGASPLPPCETSGPERPDATEMWNSYVNNHSKPMPQWWTGRRNG